MIYTLTLNPAIDYIMQIDEIKLGKTNRSRSEKMLPGGKGINVSRVLNQFQLENQALGFVGGTNGQFIKDWLAAEGSQHDFIEVEEETRINVKLKGSSETEINGAGPTISGEQSQALLDKIASLEVDDILILSGSKAKGLATNYYPAITKICEAKGIQFVIDTNSKELLTSLAAKPLLIKPNQDELGDFFETTISSLEEVKYYGRKLQEKGAQNVIISLGGDGAVFINADQIITAKAPQGHVINTVGAGDSMIAGFVAGIMHNLAVDHAFSLAIQAGSATAFSEDLARIEDINSLENQVELIVEGE